jgi:hypothetical protein
MKTFLFTKTREEHKGWDTITARIYRVKNNIPLVIGSASYNSDQTQGDLTEVLQELVKIGALPKTALNKRDTYYNYNHATENGYRILEV